MINKVVYRIDKVNWLGIQICEVCKTHHRRGYDVVYTYPNYPDLSEKIREYVAVFTCSKRCADMWILSRI